MRAGRREKCRERERVNEPNLCIHISSEKERNTKRERERTREIKREEGRERERKRAE